MTGRAVASVPSPGADPPASSPSAAPRAAGPRACGYPPARRSDHEAQHVAAARLVVHRQQGLETRIMAGSAIVDEGVQPDLPAALAMASDALAWHPDATRITIDDGHGVRWILDVRDGWTVMPASDDASSDAIHEEAPMPWAPRADRLDAACPRLIPGATPPGVSFAPTLDMVTERIDLACPACLGTHDVRDVDIDDLVYLVLGHGLRFPTLDDLERIGDPSDGRC